MKVFKEITPLQERDVYVILNSIDIGFDYPIHAHSEYELTLILKCSGNRIVGDSIEEYTGHDLVLIGPELHHKWDDVLMPLKKKQKAHVITIQFHDNLFSKSFLDKEALLSIKMLLEDSSKGTQFYGQTFEVVADRMMRLTKLKGFEGVIEFLNILNILSSSQEKRHLASEGFTPNCGYVQEGKVDKMYESILENFTDCNYRITDVASELNMSASAFGHFFKKCTNKSFTDFLINLRLGYACKLLLESDHSIGEISYMSGFNNIANFNRLFRRYKFETPAEYRKYLEKKNEFDWEDQITSNQFMPGKGEVAS